MKKILMIFICIFTLTSCFSGKNTENKENNSWNIISENSSQTGAENSQTEEKTLPTEYEVIAEKTYFYTNSTDTEPRKAYVMKWDKIIVDNEKSTENMFFATYTNSSWKTTEWFLKKSEIKAIENNSQKLEEKGEKISNCKRVYDFSVWHSENVQWTRKFEFNFVWDCAEQKNPLKIGMLGMWDVKIRLDSGQEWSFFNWMHMMDTWFPGWCGVKKPNFSEMFYKWWFFISINAWPEFCTNWDEGENTGKNRIDIEISEKWKWTIFEIFFPEMPQKYLEQNYNDLLWTLKNGFFEVGKNKNSEIIPVEKWTKEMLGEWSIDPYMWNIIFDDIAIDTGLSENDYDCEERTMTVDTNNCAVEDIKNWYITWANYYRSYRSVNNYKNEREVLGGIIYKTNIKKWTTEKIESYETETCWDWDMAEWKEIPCSSIGYWY